MLYNICSEYVIEQNRTCFMTYVMLCYSICVMLCYSMCRVMLYNTCHVMLYNEVGANSRLTAYSNKYGMSCNVK